MLKSKILLATHISNMFSFALAKSGSDGRWERKHFMGTA